jgi:cytochrome c
MDSMEINKIVGAVVGALLIFVGVNFFADMNFFGTGESHGEPVYAYALTIEDDSEPVEAAPEIPFAVVLGSADPDKGERVFGKCRACHKMDGKNGTGPHLDGLIGRGIGIVADYNYSGTLAGMGGDWTNEEINLFLADPKGYAPGTKMSFAGLRDVEDRANVIAYIASYTN